MPLLVLAPLPLGLVEADPPGSSRVSSFLSGPCRTAEVSSFYREALGRDVSKPFVRFSVSGCRAQTWELTVRVLEAGSPGMQGLQSGSWNLSCLHGRTGGLVVDFSYKKHVKDRFFSKKTGEKLPSETRPLPGAEVQARDRQAGEQAREPAAGGEADSRRERVVALAPASGGMVVLGPPICSIAHMLW